MNIALTSKTISLAPGQVSIQAASGVIFVCAQATGQFLVSFDGNEAIVMNQGWSVNVPAPGFTSLIFQNPTTSAISVSFYAGNAALAYASQQTIITVKGPATYGKGSGVIATPSTYSGTDGLNGPVRKQIIITNLDAAAALLVQDGNGVVMAEVFAGSAWTVETSGKIIIPNAGGINYCVGEIFYAP